MKNLDQINEEKTGLLQKLGDAMAGDDSEKVETAFLALCNHIQDSVMSEARALKDTIDTGILSSRGVHQLTSEEKAYYGKVIEAMKSGNPKMELQDIGEALPETVIDRVFDDLASSHPLLGAIDLTNTTAVTKWIINKSETQLAQWGDLTDEIIKEITGGFGKLDLGMFKLSAFLPVSKAMLDLGPAWLDRYVREILGESIALALEDAIVVGDGNKKPIGMNRSVADNVVVTGGVYPVRTLQQLNSLDPVTYGAFIADNLGTAANGKPRVIDKILMVVNPVDYLKKVMPATTVRTPDGRYINGVLPVPTDIVQSTRVPSGKAVFGIAKRYFMGLSTGSGKGGKIDYSDEYRFLEDERVYLIKLYGNGRPMDDVSFVWADISALEPLVQEVKVVNFSDIPVPEIEA